LRLIIIYLCRIVKKVSQRVRARVVMVGERGSPRVAVGVNQGLAHQEDLNEFSLFFGQFSHGSLLVHGFVMH